MSEIPDYEEKRLPVPEESRHQKDLPQYTDSKKEPPQAGHTENQVMFGDELIEIKATKLKYQRDRTAMFYRFLMNIPLVDILAYEDGILDPERSSDKMLFDWLVAATDDVQVVKRNYDKLDSETIEQILNIFLRLNHIQDKEQKKNKTAQMKNP